MQENLKDTYQVDTIEKVHIGETEETSYEKGVKTSINPENIRLCKFVYLNKKETDIYIYELTTEELLNVVVKSLNDGNVNIKHRKSGIRPLS